MSYANTEEQVNDLSDGEEIQCDIKLHDNMLISFVESYQNIEFIRMGI